MYTGLIMRYYLLLFFLFGISCASKKHGAHFNNHYSHYSDNHNISFSENDSTYTASIESKPSIFLKETTDKKTSKNKGHKLRIVTKKSKSHELGLTMMVSDSIPATKQGVEKKVEPMGVAGLILDIIGLAVLAVPSAFSLGLLVFGLILGIISLINIKKAKQKWKGKGFGISAIIISALFLTLVGYVIYIFSSGGFV